MIETIVSLINKDFHQFVRDRCELNNDTAKYHLENFINHIVYNNDVNYKQTRSLFSLLYDAGFTECEISGVNIKFIKKGD